MVTDASQVLRQEEIESAANPVHKDMLLQKYGIIEPKLTLDEKMKIQQEQFPFLRAV